MSVSWLTPKPKVPSCSVKWHGPQKSLCTQQKCKISPLWGELNDDLAGSYQQQQQKNQRVRNFSMVGRNNEAPGLEIVFCQIFNYKNQWQASCSPNSHQHWTAVILEENSMLSLLHQHQNPNPKLCGLNSKAPISLGHLESVPKLLLSRYCLPEISFTLKKYRSDQYSGPTMLTCGKVFQFSIQQVSKEGAGMWYTNTYTVASTQRSKWLLSKNVVASSLTFWYYPKFFPSVKWNE